MIDIKIYLCGSVRKGRSDLRPNTEFWSAEDEALIQRRLTGARLLNPSKTPIQRSDYFANFGCDLFLVKNSNFVFADLRCEKGIGVGAELMFARQSGIPVIAWLPRESHYRRDLSDVFGENLHDWIHPFAFSLSDHLEETLDDVCTRAQRILDGLDEGVNNSRNIGTAVSHFEALYPSIARELSK